VPRLLDNRATRYLFQSYMLRHKLGDGPFTRWFSAGMASTRRDYEAALAEQAEILQVVDAFFQRYALWLLPVSMGEAIPRQRRGSPIDVGGRAVPYSVYLGAYTVPTTAFETPVLTMPIGFGPTGMPIGSPTGSCSTRPSGPCPDTSPSASRRRWRAPLPSATSRRAALLALAVALARRRGRRGGTR
jgi:hypothetical protein